MKVGSFGDIVFEVNDLEKIRTYKDKTNTRTMLTNKTSIIILIITYTYGTASYMDILHSAVGADFAEKASSHIGTAIGFKVGDVFPLSVEGPCKRMCRCANGCPSHRIEVKVRR